MKCSSTGSLWRKWDLHFHTPSSFDYENNAITDSDLVEGLVAAEIAVVAITDHHVIDVERIKNLRATAGDKLTILPGIELRSELGSKPIHYIGIFPETANLEHLWDRIRGALGLTPADIRNKGGDERIYVELKTAHNVFSELGGVISIHAGAKSNSIEGIQNHEQFQQRIKLDITRNYVDILEIGQIKDILRYRRIVFPVTGLSRPMIIGSDNHDISRYSAPSPCWIKADPTFIGLRQVLNETDRVALQDLPDDLAYVDSNKTRYIQSLRFKKRSGSHLEEEWFSNVSLDFNSGLIAIIGNKGRGKSALADALGLLGRCPHEKSFAFLRPDQFRHPRESKAEQFDATLTWLSGTVDRCNLNDTVGENPVETISYIPQFHLEAICDELRGGKAGLFDGELKRVIYSRVPRPKQLGLSSLDQLIEYRVEEYTKRISLRAEELGTITSKVVNLEEQATEAYKANLRDQLSSIEEDIRAHDSGKPEPVKKPDASEETRIAQREIAEKIENLAGRIQRLNKEITSAQERQIDVVRRLGIAEKLRQKLSNFQERHKAFLSDITSECHQLELDPQKLVSFEMAFGPLDEITSSLNTQRKEIDARLDAENPVSLVVSHKNAIEEKEKLQERLDRPEKLYQEYIANLELWTEKRQSLIGSSSSPGTQAYFKEKIAALDLVPESLAKSRKEQLACARQIFEEKKKILRIYEELYEPVQEFIDTHPLAKERYGLEFRVALVASTFPDRFLNFINQGRRGSFYGESDGREVVERLVAVADFSCSEGLEAFLEEVVSRLLSDKRTPEPYPVQVADQLRQSFSSGELYKYIFGLEYLEPRYSLQWDGKPLERLSPGERGTLLLIFFLLIDDSRIPLIIDQPEGNLDNQTVYELLVDCIKEAKKRRQIFIVTHNPNLAVVCDAEQIIHADLDKEHGCQLRYSSGALENPEICQKIIDILEGTRPAIDNRISKYRIIFPKADS